MQRLWVLDLTLYILEVVQGCNLSTREGEQEDEEFKVIQPRLQGPLSKKTKPHIKTNHGFEVNCKNERGH